MRLNAHLKNLIELKSMTVVNANKWNANESMNECSLNAWIPMKWINEWMKPINIKELTNECECLLTSKEGMNVNEWMNVNVTEWVDVNECTNVNKWMWMNEWMNGCEWMWMTEWMCLTGCILLPLCENIAWLGPIS